MKVNVQLKGSTTWVKFRNVDSAFVQEGLYCIVQGQTIRKYPVFDIWRIDEKYPKK